MPSRAVVTKTAGDLHAGPLGESDYIRALSGYGISDLEITSVQRKMLKMQGDRSGYMNMSLSERPPGSSKVFVGQIGK